MSNGLVIVDKPAGLTSHDVVARLRRLAGTRRVGHAGTLDPMATGVLVVGVGAATRLLHHLVLTDKAYTATVRLGQATDTDDADGVIVSAAGAASTTPDDVRAALPTFTGEIEQVPSTVSAIKVDGKRAYARARDGEEVRLAARAVTVSRFRALSFERPSDALLDVRVEVACSSGTYVRALARDLGTALGTGGHLTALRRTRVGPFGIAAAMTLDALGALPDPVTLALPDAVRAAFRTRDVDPAQARDLSFGRSLDTCGIDGVYGAIGPDGAVLALLREAGGAARPVLVFAAAG